MKQNHEEIIAAEIARIKRVYESRAQVRAEYDRYSPFDEHHLFIVQQRQRAVLKLLRRLGLASLRDLRILEVGCGKGEVLLEYLWYGASPSRLFGADLLIEHLRHAQSKLPRVPLVCADAQQLPYLANAFGVVLQYTVFSSILHEGLKARLASEMLRVLKPNGVILWYDFWTNPFNRHTRGIRPAEIRHLFPGCRFEFHRITLAPPLCKKLLPVSRLLCEFLEKLKILNTHYLVAIFPHQRPSRT
jgi:ubiquinone/menaquinone biosynthesis C-methylase UbiE